MEKLRDEHNKLIIKREKGRKKEKKNVEKEERQKVSKKLGIRINDVIHEYIKDRARHAGE